MTEPSENLKDSMPTERKSMWRTSEERRMSDLTRVLEWLQRRQGKKKQTFQMRKPSCRESSRLPQVAQPPAIEQDSHGHLTWKPAPAAVSPQPQAAHCRNPTGRYPLKQLGRKKRKAEASPKSRKGTTRQPSLRRVEEATPSPVPRGVTCLPLPSKTPEQGTKKDKDHVMYQKLKGKRLSLVPGSYSRDNPKKSELDIKDAIVLESTQRSVPYHRQSIIDPMLQDPLFSTRRSTLLRDWVVGRMPEVSYERKLKSLMEKGAEPKVETVRMLKPEEVLSCRYLRLSKNNIRTLLKLCKDAGMNVDIHPHMVEGEIDAKKVFAQIPSVAL